MDVQVGARGRVEAPAVAWLRQLVADVHNGHRLDLLDRYHAARHEEYDPRIPPGPDGLRHFWHEMRTGFPNLRVEVDEVLAADDRVMAFLTWRGVHTGPLAGRRATGRPMNLRTSELFRLHEGRAVEHRAVVDYSVLREFGIGPVRAPGPVQPVERYAPGGAQEAANVALILDAYREVLTEHRLDRAGSFYARDYLHHNAQMPAVPNGVEAFRDYFAENFARYPDLTATVDHILAAGDRVMVFATWLGRFTGVSRGRNPTGLPLLMRTSDAFRISGGRVVEHWEVVDYSGLQDVGIPIRPVGN